MTIQVYKLNDNNYLLVKYGTNPNKFLQDGQSIERPPHNTDSIQKRFTDIVEREGYYMGPLPGPDK
ncbi:hypothetical protein [Aeromonas rivipollensis]|uniref:hypothetical protein n=1 Tax=Aeromonas rivipollensis TaxID=948519 RepID=UPI00399C7C69